MQEERFQVGVKALIMDKEGKVLILKAGYAELKYVDYEFWDLPGGRMQPGSSIEETLKREIEEELGIPSIKLRIKGIFDVGISNFTIRTKEGDHPLMLVTYNCELEGVNSFNLSDEHSEYKWASPKEASELLKRKFPKGFVSRLASLEK